ncbi:hypothetical protein IAR55_004369 [Kwoniella newhampshirensis]|uniref:Uncharacterized protein n=1 Tax=Kwoniella newhampshirensis TaxID=1651941 RepID=A0AAW0YPD1_9TREE
MELRPYQPIFMATPQQGVRSDMMMAHHLGAAVGTVRPEDIMRPPTINGSGTGTESVHISSSASGKGPSYTTDINSFPPTALPHPSVVIPPTNTSSNSASHTPSSSNLPPSSFSHRKQPTSSDPVPSPAAVSSPIPSADVLRLRTIGPGNERSFVSSTEVSSNRPLFSPTERSMSVSGAPHTSEPRVQAPVRTYGKQSSSRGTPSPQKQPTRTPIVLSSSPVSETPVRSPARGSPSKKRRPVNISDDEEEEEEQVEARTPKSRVEVVLPVSNPFSERRSSAERALTTKSKVPPQGDRHASPDPLDSITSQNPSPAKLAPASSATTGRGESIKGDEPSSSKRGSSRIANNKAKEAAEKEERRRKRREEKEKARLAEEKKRIAEEKKAQRTSRGHATNAPSRRRGRESSPQPVPDPPVEEDMVEESIMEISPPLPKATDSNRKKRKSDVAKLGQIDDGDEDGEFDPQQAESEVIAKGTGQGKNKKVKKSPAKRAKKGAIEVVEAVEQAVQDEAPIGEENQEVVVQDIEVEEAPVKSLSPPPAPAKTESPKRPPLRPTSSNTSTPNSSVCRVSPGPTKLDGTYSTPSGIKWKAPRNDLTTVLAKFGGTKRTGMSKRLRIAPLHQKIGTPVKALPPAPKKPEKKKKGDESDEEDEEEEEESDGEGGVRQKVKVKKGKGLEWFMVED